MFQLVQSLDPTLMVSLFTPPAILLAAWALRMACSFSSVKPPQYVHAVMSVLAILIANIALRYYLDYTHVSPGVGRIVLAPLLTSAAVIGLTVPTGPIASISVAVFHAGLCLIMFIGLAAVGDALIVPLFA